MQSIKISDYNDIYFNDTRITKMIYNGVVVWTDIVHKTASSASESIASLNYGGYPSAGVQWCSVLSTPTKIDGIVWSVGQSNGDSSPRDGEAYMYIKHADGTQDTIHLAHWSNIRQGQSQNASGTNTNTYEDVVQIGMYSSASNNYWSGNFYVSSWYEKGH